METIATLAQFRACKFPVSMHVNDDDIARAIYEVEQCYLKTWCGNELFEWLNANKTKTEFESFFKDLSEAMCCLAFARLLLFNIKVTRTKAVEKKSEFSVEANKKSIANEIDTYRILGKKLFNCLEFPEAAPKANFNKMSQCFILNEFVRL